MRESITMQAVSPSGALAAACSCAPIFAHTADPSREHRTGDRHCNICTCSSRSIFEEMSLTTTLIRGHRIEMVRRNEMRARALGLLGIGVVYRHDVKYYNDSEGFSQRSSQ